VSQATLCVFARAPVAGRVKSRLAETLGTGAALAAHVQLVEDTLARLVSIADVATELWLDDVEDAGGRRWARQWQLPLRQQKGGDLGARMHHALQSCLDANAVGMVVGTDCPAIDAGYVQSAARALDSHDVVLGPAQDGGYGLIGARRPVPELFRGIAWGSDAVLAQTLARAAVAGLDVAQLPQIWDVDTALDWRRYLALRQRG